MTPNTRTLKGQSYCSQRGANPAWPKGSKSRGFSTYGRFYNLRMRYSIPCVKANATKCFPKAEVDNAMAQEAERLGSNLSEHWYSCFDIMRLFGLGKTQVRRFALTHGVRTKRIHGNRLYYLKADWDEARKVAERKSASTKAKREPDNESDNN